MQASVVPAVRTAPDPLRWAAPLFRRLIARIDQGLRVGAIEATLPDGRRMRVGGHADGPVAIVTLNRWRAMWRLATGGSAGWYEAWADGDWSSPDPVPLFDLFMRNAETLGNAARAGGVSRLFRRLGHRARRNDRAGARRNIAAHYDLGNDFYREWLDPTLTYSSAMFDGADEAHEVAQTRKLRSILDRTGTVPGDRILEIGCGWGSFAALAAGSGRRVDAITLSREQKAHVDALRLPGVSVSLTDYRDVRGTYDGVVSIEMVEAVGQEYWPAYLDAIAAALKPGGRAAIQYIAIAEPLFAAYADNVDFIQAYVFPGGMLLSEQRFRALAEARGLRWTAAQHFGADYAETLRKWRVAFDAAYAEGRLPAKVDDGFAALWRYYLMYCEGGFRGGGITVAQVTLVKDAG